MAYSTETVEMETFRNSINFFINFLLFIRDVGVNAKTQASDRGMRPASQTRPHTRSLAATDHVSTIFSFSPFRDAARSRSINSRQSADLDGPEQATVSRDHTAPAASRKSPATSLASAVGCDRGG